MRFPFLAGWILCCLFLLDSTQAATRHSSLQRSRVSAYDFYSYEAPRLGFVSASPKRTLQSEFLMEYKLRTAANHEDQDLFLHYQFNAMTTYSSGKAFSTVFSGRFERDIDGFPGPGRSPFTDIRGSDSEDNQIYEFYSSESNPTSKGSLWKIGRQFLYNSQFLWFDGFLMERRDHSKHTTQYFGGRRVRPDSIAFREKESFFAIHDLWTVSADIRLSLLFLHNREESQLLQSLPTFSKRIHSIQNLWKLGTAWQINKEWKMRFDLSKKNSQITELNLSGEYLDMDNGHQNIRWNYSSLLERTNLEDRTFEALGLVSSPLEPYDQYQIQWGQLVNSGKAHLSLNLLDRSLKNNQTQGIYNREFRQVHTTLQVYQWMKHTTLTLSANLWDSISRQLHHGVEINLKPGKHSEIGFGTYYSVYKTDYLLNRDNLSVRNYYLEYTHHKKDSRVRFLVEKEIGFEDVMIWKVQWKQYF